MALVIVKVLKSFEHEGVETREGQELVMRRKEATTLNQRDESNPVIEIGRVLDPKNPDDTALVDQYLKEHGTPENRPVDTISGE